MKHKVKYDLGQRWTAYCLAACLALLALINAGPVAYSTLVQFRAERPVELPGWTLILLTVSAMQLAYVLYLAPLPDYSTVWTTALLTLLTAVGYAAGLALMIWAPPENGFLTFLEFDLKLRGRVAMWCAGLLGCNALLAYFCGQEAFRWQRMSASRFATYAMSTRTNLARAESGTDRG